MGFPNETADLRRLADRVGRDQSPVSRELFLRMGKFYRLVLPILKVLPEWLGTEMESAIFEAIRLTALRIHERVAERYYRLQEQWPSEKLGIAHLFLNRMLVTDPRMKHLIQEKLKFTEQLTELALLDEYRRAELFEQFSDMRAGDWFSPSVWEDVEWRLPEECIELGEWVRKAFIKVFGNRPSVGEKEREEIALALVDEASLELLPSLRLFEESGWQQETLLCFLLHDVVDAVGWSETQARYSELNHGGYGVDDPILSETGRMKFSGELGKTLQESHLRSCLWRDPDFLFGFGPYLEAEKRWTDSALPKVYLWLSNQPDWRVQVLRFRAGNGVLDERLSWGEKIIRSGFEAVFGVEGLKYLEKKRLAGNQLNEEKVPFDPEVSDGYLGIYVDAMKWIGMVQSHLGITDPGRLTEGAALADSEFIGAGVPELLRKIRTDVGLQMDCGALLNWAVTTNQGEADRFRDEYRRKTGREGWFEVEALLLADPLKRIIEGRMVAFTMGGAI